MNNWEYIISTFIVLWAVIDPIGTIPVFIAVTKNYDNKERRRIARRAVVVAGSILLFFIVVGESLLHYLGVTLLAFQISGGIILFLFALSMIFGDSKPEEELKIIKSGRETAVFPLASPSIAGPGAIMAVVMLTDKTRFSIGSQMLTVSILATVLILQLLLLLGSNWIFKWIGEAGASVVSRVMGLILASVACTYLLSGIKLYFKI